MKKKQHAGRLVFVEDLVHQIIEELTKSHQSYLQVSVLVDARSLASKNLPHQDETTAEPLLTPITGFYKGLKKQVSVKMQGGLQKFFGAVSLGAMDEKIEGVKGAITKDTDTINNLETDKGRLNVNKKHGATTGMQFLLRLFALAESLLLMSSFLRMGDIVIIAFVLGVVVGLAQIYAAKVAVLFIRELPDAQKRKRYFILSVIGFALFSIFLGAIRYYFAHQGTAANIPFIILNPFTFAAINMLLVVASGLVVFFFFPTKSEMQELRQIKELTNDIIKCQKHKAALQVQYDHLMAERVQAVKVHGALAHSQKELFQLIHAYYEEAVGKFVHENITKRTDGIFPACFKQNNFTLSDTVDTDFLLTEN